MTSQSGYRPDIAGLRALAVFPVLFYHYRIAPFSGGFVGVDVFFVISGYLITQKIWNALAAGSFSLPGFYDARIRRILPAALTMIAAVLIVSGIVLLPQDLADVGSSAVFAAFGFSNFYFMMSTGGYFGADADLMPLLHTWSLAVEEQFYLLWPIALLALHRFFRGSAKAVAVALGLIIVVSLMLSVAAVVGDDRNLAFYMLPTRAWELALGALIVFMPAIRNRLAGDIAAISGLAMLLFAIFSLTERSPFPGWNAVLPCVGAALLVWPKADGSLVGGLLSIRPMRFFGDISYSLYLWHWPLLVLYRQYGVGDMPNDTMTAALLALSILLATLSLHLVENPIRRRRFAYRLTIPVGLFAAAVVAAGGRAYAAYDGLPWRLPELAGFYAEFAHKGGRGARSHCFLTSGGERRQFAYDWENCLKLSNEKPNVLVVGDSHANHFMGALRATYPGINFLQATSSGCQPMLQPTGAKRCVDLIDPIFERHIPGMDLDAVIISAKWKRDGIAGLRRTVEKVAQTVPKVIVMGPTIEYRRDVPTLLARAAMSGRDGLAKSRRYQDSAERQAQILRNLRGSSAQYVSVLDAICPTGSKSCRALTPEGVPMQYDRAHLTFEGALHVIRHVDIGFSGAQMPGD